jgi:CRP-like cAMP-binding protein
MKMINIFRNSPDIVVFEAGQTIFNKGDTGDAMYVVVEGEVSIIHQGTEVATMGEGEIFGEMGLIDNAPRSAAAVAKTTAKVVTVDQKRFNFLVQQNPFFALSVMRIMSDRLRKQLPKA